MSGGESLCCMALLERIVADAYGRAARGATDPSVGAALEFISADSAKHARVLEALASGAGCTRELCGELMGVAWRSEVEASERVSGFEDLLEGLGDLYRLESAVGEEYAMPAYAAAEVLRGPGSELASELLKMISEDERRHARLLSLIGKSVGARRRARGRG